MTSYYDFEQRLARLEREVAADRQDVRRELADLRALVAGSPAPAPAPASVAAPPASPVHTPPAWQSPRFTDPAPAPPPALPPRTPLRDRIPPITTSMVLAWMGGAIAVLGVTFLFVYAASRGWFVPPLRLAVGALVSGGLLAFATWFHHRRGGRYEAVLAAAGAGIAGLYATLFAASQVYHYLNRPEALLAAGAIAVAATVVALDVNAEPLAVFGVCAAILAPLLVAHGVTPLGLAFGALIGGAGLVCMIRRGWTWVTASVLAVGLPQVLWIAAANGRGAGLWVLGPVLFALLWGAAMFVHALRPAPPRMLDWLTAALASAVASTLGVTAFQAGRGEQVAGHASNGVLLLGVAALLLALAFLPSLLNREHPDLADLLGAYSLTALAIAIGLLLHGSALVVGWAVEAGALAVAAGRVRRRAAPADGHSVAGSRADRMLLGASVYLVTALVALGRVAPPLTFATIDRWGAHSGLVGLIGMILGSAVWAGVAIATRGWSEHRRWTAALPLAVAVYAVPFFVGGEWVIVGWSAMVAALSAALAEPRARRVVGEMQLLAGAIGVAALAAGVTVHRFAPVEAAGSIAAWGSHQGLVPLAALLAAGVALAAGALCSSFAWRRWLTAAPVAVLAYATPFVLSGDWVILAWTAMAAMVAVPLYVRRLRELFGEAPLLVESTSLLGLAAGVAAHHDDLARQIVDHGRDHGIVVALCLTAASVVIALGVSGRYRRALAFRVPMALACVAMASFLPGAWAVAGWGLVAGATAAAVWVAPARVRRLFDLRVTLESAAWLAAIVAAVGIAVYETPARLFHANSSPATGIVALLAATAVAWLVAGAARATGLRLRPLDLSAGRIAMAAAVLGLWSLTALLLGIAELQPHGVAGSEVERHFQQGQVAVSVTWGLTGLLLLYLGFRRHSRALRSAGVVLLFVTPLKLVVYDLAFLPTTARAASFIVTGIVLIGAALLMQRLGDGDGAAGNGRRAGMAPTST